MGQHQLSIWSRTRNSLLFLLKIEERAPGSETLSVDDAPAKDSALKSCAVNNMQLSESLLLQLGHLFLPLNTEHLLNLVCSEIIEQPPELLLSVS